MLFERNRTTANRVAGIFFEISQGAVIHDNVVYSEGENQNRTGIDRGAGILVNTSSNVEIFGNKVTDCPNGIIAVRQDRGISRRLEGPHTLKNLHVHDNTVTQKDGVAAGIRSSPSLPPIDPSNRFDSNVYYLGRPSAQAFVWNQGTRTIEDWKSSGNDRSGRFGPIP